MRRVSVLAALLLGLGGAFGCSVLAGESTDLATDDDRGDRAGAGECAVDSDCSAAGESCCECPSYAVPTASGWDDSCEDVSCQEPASCSSEAACDQGQCVLRCAVVSCAADRSCDGGFARDGAGCLTCECASSTDPDAAECQLDADCVQAPADCCGCSLGGSDTAVPQSEAGGFNDSLGCDSSQSCPGVDICDPDATPRCVAGSCQLMAADDSPGGSDGPDGGVGEALPLCGTPELPSCPAGQSCVLNDADSQGASEMGLGVCR